MGVGLMYIEGMHIPESRQIINKMRMRVERV